MATKKKKNRKKNTAAVHAVPVVQEKPRETGHSAERSAAVTPLPRKIKGNFWKEHVWEILSFCIPVLFVVIGFIIEKIYPVGTRQYLVTDNWHQYYPFFQLLHEKLQTGGSLLYSWRSGMGTNFIALMAYYGASPLNLLSVLVPLQHLREAFTVILLLKFGFCGLFFSKMLRYVFGKNDVSITMFSVMYALCSYMMGYYWNTIWLDIIALMPLVMLGLTALVREGKYRTYVLSLALSLFTNYYIAYFVCLFTVLAFFCLCILEGLDKRTFGKRFGQVVGCSLLGAGISALMLIPTYLALQLTHSANDAFPKGIHFYEKWRDILANMLPFTEVTSKEGLPNIYCGWLPVLLIGAFLLAKKIRIREKIIAIFMLAFMLVSCNLKTLNFIWHAFHFTNMLPYRFSFLFSFVLLVTAFRAYHVFMDEKPNLVQWEAMLGVGVLFCALAVGTKPDAEDGHRVVLSAAILGVVYLAVFLIRKKAPKHVVQILLACVLTFEMGTQAVNGVEKVGSSDRKTYPASGSDISVLLEYQREHDDDLFYRTELNSWYTLNDPALYLYNGVSLFSSMVNESITTYMRKIGLPAAEASNRYFYANSCPLNNMLTGVKYVISKDNYNADTAMERLEVSGNCGLFENQYALPIGFMMDQAVQGFDIIEDEDPFVRQNALFRQMTGIDKDLYTQIDVTNVGHQGYTVTRNSYANYNYSRDEDAEGGSFLKYNYTPLENGMLYGCVKISDVENMEVYCNEEKLHRYNVGRQPYITPLGSFSESDKVTIRAEMSDERKSGTVKIYVYSLNQDVLDEGYALLQKGGMELTDFSDTSLSGTVNAQMDGIFYMSIPYEKGWTAYVDGKKADLEPVFGAMCSLPLTEGSHTIEMRYCPDGFIPGVIVSVSSAAVFILLVVLDVRRKKKAGQAV